MTQWHGGKGYTQRPKSIADEEYAQRWDAIFGKDLKEDDKDSSDNQAKAEEQDNDS